MQEVDYGLTFLTYLTFSIDMVWAYRLEVSRGLYYLIVIVVYSLNIIIKTENESGDRVLTMIVEILYFILQ